MKLPLVYRFFFVFLLIGSTGVLAKAQTATTREKAHPKALKDFDAGVQASFAQQDKDAIRYFESALKREPKFADALLELSAVYYDQGNFAEAEKYLERVVQFSGKASTEGLYGLALNEIKQEKYGEAVPHLDRYLKTKNLREDRREAAERFRAEAAFRDMAMKNPVDFDLVRLPEEINSREDSEYLPSFTADENTLVFARNVGGRQEDFFVSYRDDTGSWSPAQPISSLNTDENDAGQTLSADGNLMVFTGCNRKGGAGSCDLYYSTRLADGTWAEPRNMGAPINTKAWESQPSLAPNGNLLFFASRRKEGHGGSDLYASGRTADGGWTEPLNLGPIINTPKDDQSPFFHADGKTLYFMSLGHVGMGGFDLYKTEIGDDNIWTTPQNLGYPINTKNNEGALVVALDGKTAYFATDNESTGIDSIQVGSQRSGSTDLFQFTLPPAARAGVVTYVRAKVVNAETNEPIAAAALFTNAANDKPYLKRRADAEKGEFLAVLPSGKTYALTVEEPGYLFYSDRFAMVEPASAEKPFELLIRLQPIKEEAAPTTVEAKPIVLRNVLFETASADLLAQSTAELDRLKVLLEENATMRIRIQGHTDNVGDESANLSLSTRRAEAVKSYLISNGIDAGRLESKGFGESSPIESNDTDEGRALNRRTEFLVLG